MKKKSLFIFIIICVAAMLIAAFAGCDKTNTPNTPNGSTGGNGGDNKVAVTSVTLSDTEITLTEGESVTLLYNIAPSNATDKSVAWFCDNGDVADVKDGVVTAVGAGNATVTVKSGNGKSATCKVTVNDLVPPPGGTWVMFNLNGHGSNSPQPSEIVDGKAVKPADPTDSGYDFGGWFENEDCTGTAVDFATKTFEGNTTLYAKWTAKQTTQPPEHTHTYKYEDLNSTSHKKTCKGCADINVTEAHDYDNDKDTTCNLCGHTRKVESETPVIPPHTSHTYKYEDLNATSHKKTCKGCADINVTEAHDYDNDKDTTCNLCGHIRTVESEQPKLKYTVMFISDGETLTDLTEQVEEGGKVKEPKGVTKEGYTLKGWAVGSVSGAVYSFDEPVDKNLTLYAVWEKNQTQTPVTPPDDNTPITYSYAGNECAAFEWTESNAANAKVEYKKSSESSYVTVDKQLIRDIGSGKVRVDIVGLAGGVKYDFKITTSAGNSYVKSGVDISKYDRSGYAHFGKSDGVGAYKDDGTLKSGAVVVYVTEATKNTVKATVNGKEYTGIVSILQNAGTSTPLVVRIIGTVGAATWKKGKVTYTKTSSNTDSKGNLNPEVIIGANGKDLGKKSWNQADLISGGYNELDTSVYTELKGLNSKISWNSGKNEYDSCWNDCAIQNVKNVTVEGIGEDARIFQWGMTWKNCDSIEVRNITFEDYTEDACSFEGGDTSVSGLSGFKHKNFWIHHNTFEQGINYWDVCKEQDKHEGDGATDFKGLSNVTISHNVYHDNHKTGLIGGDNKQTTANITFHHNYYNHCNSRLPLARQANMHMYNNYYYNTTGTNMSLRAGAYAFIENCYFENANNPIVIEARDETYGIGAAKLLGNVFNKKSPAKNSYLYEVSDRTATVKNENKFSQDFDTNSSVFYYKDGKSDVTEMLTAVQVKTEIPKVAGVQKRGSGTVSGGTTSGGTTGGTTGGNTGDTESGEKITYNYSYNGTNADVWSTDIIDTNFPKLSDGETNDTDASHLSLKIQAGKYLTLNASGKKATVSVTGFTTSTSGASELLLIEFLDANGKVVGTLKGTTTAKKVIGEYTFASNVFQSAAAFASVRFTCGTDGKHTSINSVNIVIE